MFDDTIDNDEFFQALYDGAREAGVNEEDAVAFAREHVAQADAWNARDRSEDMTYELVGRPAAAAVVEEGGDAAAVVDRIDATLAACADADADGM